MYLTKLNYLFPCKQDYSYPVDVNSLILLFLKVEQLRLESALSFFFGRHFYIKMHDIFNLPLYFDFIQLSTRIKIATALNLSTLEFMLYLSCKLRMASIFAQYLAKSLELENKHRKIL